MLRQYERKTDSNSPRRSDYSTRHWAVVGWRRGAQGAGDNAGPLRPRPDLVCRGPGGCDLETITTGLRSPLQFGSTGPTASVMMTLRGGGAWVDGILAWITAVVLVGCCEITVIQLRSVPINAYMPTLHALQAQPRLAPVRPDDDVPAQPASMPSSPESTTATPTATPVGAAIPSPVSVLSARALARPRATPPQPPSPPIPGAPPSQATPPSVPKPTLPPLPTLPPRPRPPL